MDMYDCGYDYRCMGLYKSSSITCKETKYESTQIVVLCLVFCDERTDLLEHFKLKQKCQ